MTRPGGGSPELSLTRRTREEDVGHPLCSWPWRHNQVMQKTNSSGLKRNAEKPGPQVRCSPLWTQTHTSAEALDSSPSLGERKLNLLPQPIGLPKTSCTVPASLGQGAKAAEAAPEGAVCASGSSAFSPAPGSPPGAGSAKHQAGPLETANPEAAALAPQPPSLRFRAYREKLAGCGDCFHVPCSSAKARFAEGRIKSHFHRS